MRKHYLLVGSLSCISLSCTQTIYYVSPLHGSVTPYHSIPLKKENVSSAVYANSSFQAGGANSDITDNTLHWQGNIYRTHQLGCLQAYYGGGLTLGNYHVARIDSSPRLEPGLGILQINATAGNKFYGSGNIQGGIHFSIPYKQRRGGSGEIRLGINSALHQEFGKYLNFRRVLNADSLSGLVKNNMLGSFAFTGEIIMKQRKDRYFGIAGEFGCLLGKDYRDVYFGKGVRYYDDPHVSRYSYISGTLHYTFNNAWTIYIQQTLGTRVFAFHTGVNYRLFAKRKKPL